MGHESEASSQGLEAKRQVGAGQEPAIHHGQPFLINFYYIQDPEGICKALPGGVGLGPPAGSSTSEDECLLSHFNHTLNVSRGYVLQHAGNRRNPDSLTS